VTLNESKYVEGTATIRNRGRSFAWLRMTEAGQNGGKIVVLVVVR
jgi:hypothetical protein